MYELWRGEGATCGPAYTRGRALCAAPQLHITYPPDGLLTSGNTKHDVDLEPHIIAPDPVASDNCLDEFSPVHKFLLNTTEGLDTMNTGGDEPSSSLNGRLRPRKSNNANSQTYKVLRKADGKSFSCKPKRISTPSKVSPNKSDELVNKSDNTPVLQLLCPYCDKKFTSRQTASKHARRIHLSPLKQDFVIDCLFCNHAESQSNDIIRHMVDSHPNQYFACLDCHTRFSSTSDLAEHKLNVCEKQKIPYRSKLRQKSSEIKKNQKTLCVDGRDNFRNEKEFSGGHGFNGIVISCELKPAHVHDDADIEDNITTNLILPSGKGIGNNAILIKFYLGWVWYTDPPVLENLLKKDWLKTADDSTQKFEKCFDTSFYTKVASNVQENLSKYLDGSFNANPDRDTTIKTRKAKNCVTINAVEGFPTLLACEQYSRNLFDSYMPRAVAPKHKWKWDSPENDRSIINPDQMKRDSHLNNCIITLVSSLDIWTQLSMRRKFEDKFNSLPLGKKTEKQNTISKELKEILESRDIPTSSTQVAKYTSKAVTSSEGIDFPALLGLTPATPSYDLQPAVLSGEWVRPRCYVCCACGAQTRDSRALSTHISTQHPNAYVQHYEIVGEPLLNADILKHLYLPPSQNLNRTRPLRGFRECTKCKKSVTLEELHQHMLDCAGDTPAVRRKCRYRPFGVRKRRSRLPDNRIRKKMRKDMRTGQANDKNHMRSRPRIRSEVGDAETIRKMLADLPAKRHRVMVNPLNSLPRKTLDGKRNKLIMKQFSSGDRKKRNTPGESPSSECSKAFTNIKHKHGALNNDEEDDEDDNLPLRPKTNSIENKISRHKKSLNKNAIMNRSKRKPIKEMKVIIEKSNDISVDCTEDNQPEQLSIDNTPARIDVNVGPCNMREHSSRGGSNNRDDQQPGCSQPNGNLNNSTAPTQNVPLKHSIARLTADSETHDKSVQFHHLFLVQQECNNIDHHLPSDRRMLFENEAVVTKLDKPPLHFNQKILEHENPRRNKLSKPRKGLNDCIAMLKNKLTPANESDVPGHVSVQCGTDDPIEPEPIIIEKNSTKIDANPNIVKKTTDPIILSQVSIQSSAVEQVNIEQLKPRESNCDVTSREITTNDKNNEELIFRNHTPEPEQTCQDKVIAIDEHDDTVSIYVSTTQSNMRLENESAHNFVPLAPPRNTVIRKSPKMSINSAAYEEELKIKYKNSPAETMDSIKKGCKTLNMNDANLLSELSPKLTADVPFECSNTQSRPMNAQVQNDLTDNLFGLTSLNTCSSGLKSHVKPRNQENICFSSKELNIQHNHGISRKVSLEYSPADFQDVPIVIPPAHASTNVESILSTPLDLSGKKNHIDDSVNSSNQEISFIENTYESYETLDLSNKNVSVAESLKGNVISKVDHPTDVIVDLSIKPTPQCPQDISANLRTKPAIIDATPSPSDLSYENVPTDLSIKKVGRTASVDLIPKRPETDFVHDLSNHKSFKQREAFQDCFIETEYDNKDMPTDLSGKTLKDKSSVIDISSREIDAKTKSRETKGVAQIDLTQKSTQIINNACENIATERILDVTPPLNENICEGNEINILENPPIHFLPLMDENDNTTTIQRHFQTTPISRPENTYHSSDSRHVTIIEETDHDDGTIATETVSNNSLVDKVVLTQEKLLGEIERPILSLAVCTIGNTIPLYTLINRNIATHVPGSKLESTTPVYTLANACISVTKIDTSCSATLTNALLSIPGTIIASTKAVYTLAGTTVDPSVNYGTVSFPNQVSSGSTSINEHLYNIPDNDLTSEVKGFESNSTQSSNILKENDDHAKEEIIDCDLEEDFETARKIAMLPRELVEILGNMPVDHRNQLLNVLPHYVSNSASLPASDTALHLKNRSRSESIGTPSPLMQDSLKMGQSHNEITPKKKNNDQVSVNSQELNNISVRMVGSTSASPSVLHVSAPQSVILKTPTFTEDHKIKKSLNTTATNRVVDHQPKAVPLKDIQNAIIDLTDDENGLHIQDDVQIIEDDLSLVTKELNRNLEGNSNSSKQKGMNDQTASLRAVRIKGPSERNKQTFPENSLESQNDYNPSITGLSDQCEYSNDDKNIDIQKHDNEAENKLSQITIINTPLKVNESELSTFDPNQTRASVFAMEKGQAANHQEVLIDSTSLKSTIIIKPNATEKKLDEFQDKSNDEGYDRNNTNRESIDSSPNLFQNEGDREVIILDFNGINETRTCDASEDITSLAKPHFCLDNRYSPTRQFMKNSDEDSDDDVSLAVIVKQKQHDQSKLSSMYDKSTGTPIDPTTDSKNRKKEKRNRKSDPKSIDNEMVLKTNTENTSNNSDELIRNCEEIDGTVLRKNCLNLVSDEDEVTNHIHKRKTRKRRLERSVTKSEITSKNKSNSLEEIDVTRENNKTFKNSISKTKNIEVNIKSKTSHQTFSSKTIDIGSNEIVVNNGVQNKCCYDNPTQTFEIKNDLKRCQTSKTVKEHQSNDVIYDSINSNESTVKEYLQETNRSICPGSRAYTNSSVKEIIHKKLKDIDSKASFVAHECCQINLLIQPRRIESVESINSKSDMSSVCTNYDNSCGDEKFIKLHNDTRHIEFSDKDFTKKKAVRMKKHKNVDATGPIVGPDGPGQSVLVENEESKTIPLRRSRRGKSLFVDSNLADPEISYQSCTTELKTPLTKKQLIFSKLLLDEDNITKPITLREKEPIVIIKNVKINSHVTSVVRHGNNNDKKSQESVSNASKQSKASKRKKSPQVKRKTKKIKSADNVRVESVCLSHITKNNRIENNSKLEKHNHDQRNNQLQSKNETCVENTKILAAQNQDCIGLKQNAKKVECDYNDAVSTNLCNPDLSHSGHLTTNTISSFVENRKICCTITSADIISTYKKSKFNNELGISKSSKKEEEKQNNDEENLRKSRARNPVTETRNKTCYNSHIAARRTRSKSVVVKSSTSSYDPYNIDLEEMVDKTEPFGKRLMSSEKVFNGFLRDQDFKKRNKSETSVGVNTEPISNGDNIDSVQIQNKTDNKFKENIGNLSDSDDSSKSDIPLQKYVEEKEKKNLESSCDNSIPEAGTASGNNEVTKICEKDVDLKDTKKNDGMGSAEQESEQHLRSEQFMESFGFFSERKPRKSNLLATKKISETFHIIANESDDVNSDPKERTNKKTAQTESKNSNEDESSRDSSQSPTKKATKRGRKKTICTKPIPSHCLICKKEFRRPDNYLRHQMTLLHISKLSEIEMKIKTTPVYEEPNYLVAYKQQLDRLRYLTEKMAKRKKSSKSTSKMTLPTLDEILADVNRTVREQQLSRRNLSRDEALFLDCCELLKESHKPDIPNTDQITITSDVSNILTSEVTVVNEISGLEKSDEKYDTRSDGDVDSITAKNILESEEVRNLENDLISGLKEAAANSLTQTVNSLGYQPSISEVNPDRNTHTNDFSSLPLTVSSHESVSCCEQPVDELTTSKCKKSNEVKDKMYPDVIDTIDMFEDKFDKIKRKCRSQAAAAKHVQPVVESSSSPKGRKKSERKKGKRSSKKNYHNSILTKGALKGFDGIKVSIPTSDINMAAIVPPIEGSSKKKRKSNPKKKTDKMDVEIKCKSNTDHRPKTTPQKVDVYEFMDNDDAELFEFRPSTLMERFKTINSRAAPSTSKFIPHVEKDDLSSESGSDGDDFVYDDYVCSDDETENSLMSCELGNGKIATETRKTASSLKRKDVVEKNAVMGKIFKHNAVRTEKKSSKTKEQVKAKANLDQLFDSLLEDEPGPSSSNNSSSKKEESISPKINESVSLRKCNATIFKQDTGKSHSFTSLKKNDSVVSSKRHDSPSEHINSDSKPSTSKKHNLTSAGDYYRTSPKKHVSSKHNATSSIECEPSTSKKSDEGRHSSKKFITSSSKDYPKSSQKKIENSSPKKYDTMITEKYDSDSPSFCDDSLPSCSKDISREKSPLRQFEKDIYTNFDYTVDTLDDAISDDAGVARQRVRRKCTVGKQNVLAETWSSESEPDGGPPRPNSAESVVSVVGRKKKGKKKEGQPSGVRRGVSRQMPIKRQDVESRVALFNRSASSVSGRSGSSGDSQASSSGTSAASTASTSTGGVTSPSSRVPLGPPGPKVRPRSAAYYWSSEGDEEQEHIQQHGWIVGDSHKKLVTMLAHAKRRKRNNDEKRHVVD
ncbi:unnamed protein product [Parnassius apollo]|uniref:(apollo) hypothetical protein n=1 Tax=Parnassius apollo TaxID=110799 RepID=A0A8S3WI93_PARAO|nr:unnamed protein product [Parnassius apollo]